MRNLFYLFCLACLTFSMVSCEEENPIISGKITKIDVLTFPSFDENGDSWDNFQGLPDIYVKFNRGTDFSTGAEDTANRYDDAVSPGTFAFDVDWDLDVLGDTYTLGIYDYDLIDPLDGDDEMGKISFVPDDYTDESSKFNITSGNVSINVTVEWTRGE